jgi:hypothetical protein
MNDNCSARFYPVK